VGDGVLEASPNRGDGYTRIDVTVTQASERTARSGFGSDALSRRLLPLYGSSFFGALALWVPIEKLFMTSIGFTSATVGVMAAVYAVVVPVLEVPSGILADRWSRRGVLLLASLAAIIAVVIGGLSQSVPVYMVSAVFLGVFFALQSGTFESIVYDTVIEESGDSEAFERTIGRVRVIESVALVTSALMGGLIAQVAPLQTTYFATVPLLVTGLLLLLTFREPRLHKSEEGVTLRNQIAATYRTILTGGQLRLVILLTIAGALLMQGMLEFGPLWLVALAVPPFLYGPHWAGLTGALGVGGLIGTRASITRPWAAPLLGATLVASSLVLVVSSQPLVVVAVQILLTLIVVAISIPVTRSLHDNVPSPIRAGVASGVGMLTWLAFVPFALLVGSVSQEAGIGNAGWLFVGVALVTAVLMLVVLPRARPAPEQAVEVERPVVAIERAGFPTDRFLPPDDPAWPGHWAQLPTAWSDRVVIDGPDVLGQAQAAIAEMPPALRQVIVLRDLEGRSSDDVRRALQISPEEERTLLQQARSLVRARLERHLDGAGAMS
jgi:MFS family permease